MKLVALLVVPVLGAVLTASGPKLPVIATSTEHFDFAAGGAIRFEGSYGNLNVEGWDRPEVEITITKSSPDFDSTTREQGRLGLDRIHVVTTRRSDRELVVSTTPPPETTSLMDSIAKRRQGGVTLDYDVHVPRHSQLVIQHGSGLVFIDGVSGDIDATSSRGDIVLMLPGEGAYSIDARCKLGKLTSDFAGDSHRTHFVGERLAASNRPDGQRIRLRMGIGSIAVKSEL